jgi:hypothetical protein
MGGKDIYGVQTNEVEEFNTRDMQNFPVYWKIPQNLAGFSACLVKEGLVAICGGTSGVDVKNSFYMLNLSAGDIPEITEMPPMLERREEFALVAGSDGRLYAIGGYNQEK